MELFDFSYSCDAHPSNSAPQEPPLPLVHVCLFARLTRCKCFVFKFTRSYEYSIWLESKWVYLYNSFFSIVPRFLTIEFIRHDRLSRPSFLIMELLRVNACSLLFIMSNCLMYPDSHIGILLELPSALPISQVPTISMAFRKFLSPPFPLPGPDLMARALRPLSSPRQSGLWLLSVRSPLAISSRKISDAVLLQYYHSFLNCPDPP